MNKYHLESLAYDDGCNLIGSLFPETDTIWDPELELKKGDLRQLSFRRLKSIKEIEELRFNIFSPADKETYLNELLSFCKKAKEMYHRNNKQPYHYFEAILDVEQFIKKHYQTTNPDLENTPPPNEEDTKLIDIDESILNLLITESKKLFKKDDHQSLELLLKGSHIENPILYPHTQMEWADVFRRLKEKKYTSKTKKYLQEWLSKYFLTIDEESGRLKPFNLNTVRRVISQGHLPRTRTIINEDWLQTEKDY